MSDVEPAPDPAYDDLHGTIVMLLLAARQQAARRVNALMTATYREIGRRIVTLEQGGAERAAYGESLLERLARDLSARFGRGFSATNLEQMRAFHLAWPVARTGQTPSDGFARGATDALALATKRRPSCRSVRVTHLAFGGKSARVLDDAGTCLGDGSVRRRQPRIDGEHDPSAALSRDRAAMLGKGASDASALDERRDGT